MDCNQIFLSGLAGLAASPRVLPFSIFLKPGPVSATERSSPESTRRAGLQNYDTRR